MSRCKVSECEFSRKSDSVVLLNTGTPTRAIRVRQKPCTHGLADADIVSAFPLSFSTFLENINILRQTSSTWHRILREFCVLESFQKPVAPAGYKNKQCRKQTSVLSGRIVTAYVPLRSATERERAAFLIPCQGLRGFDSISLLTLKLH